MRQKATLQPCSSLKQTLHLDVPAALTAAPQQRSRHQAARLPSVQGSASLPQQRQGQQYRQHQRRSS
jgi:hypothetical protein